MSPVSVMVLAPTGITVIVIYCRILHSGLRLQLILKHSVVHSEDHFYSMKSLYMLLIGKFARILLMQLKTTTKTFLQKAWSKLLKSCIKGNEDFSQQSLMES